VGGPGDVIHIHNLQDGVLAGGLHLLAGLVCHGQPGGHLDCNRYYFNTPIIISSVQFIFFNVKLLFKF
jgi:hypothetical protein